MLRTRILRSNILARLPPSHRPILSSRLASSATAHSSSHDLHRNRSPLYTVTPLPPIPPPLPADVPPSETSHIPPSQSTAETESALSAGVTVAHQLPAAQEQLAVLNACLSSGDITRAEDVAKRIKANWTKSGELGSLSTLLPCRVHADFLKAYFVRALQPFLQENNKSQKPKSSTTAGEYEGLGLPSLVEQRNLPNHSALSMRNNVQSTRHISKAWAYFDSLYGPQWDAFDHQTRKIKRGVNGAIDAGVFAAMFKGLVKLGPDVYNPSSLTDPDRVFRPITYLLPAMRKAKIDLESVMKDSIFDVDLPSYLGNLEREQVLDALQETGRGREGWEEWERIVDEVRTVLARMREGREKEQQEKPQVPELDPVMATVSFAIVHRYTFQGIENFTFYVSTGRSSQRFASNSTNEPLYSLDADYSCQHDSYISTTTSRRIFLRRSSTTLPSRDGIARESRQGQGNWNAVKLVTISHVRLDEGSRTKLSEIFDGNGKEFSLGKRSRYRAFPSTARSRQDGTHHDRRVVEVVFGKQCQ